MKKAIGLINLIYMIYEINDQSIIQLTEQRSSPQRPELCREVFCRQLHRQNEVRTLACCW